MTTRQILKQVKKDRVKFIQLQFTDILGVVKSLTIPVTRLANSLKHGTWFDGSSIEGFARIAESDLFLMPDISTYSLIPWLISSSGNTARFICDVFQPDGKPFPGDPRLILKRVVAEARSLGFEYNTGPELEFYLFQRNNGLKALPHDIGGYFDLTNDQAYEIRNGMTVALEQFGIRVETSIHECGAGQHEIDFKYDQALRTADNAVTLRFVHKAIAQKHNLHATFMPKPITGLPGNGMHVHQSLFDRQGKKNLFYQAADKYHLSPLAYHFMAGQLAHIKGMTALLCPTVNSYKRLVPGYEAPVYISWARTNRSALIRIPAVSQGRADATRMELRCPDPTCNVYLAFAVMLKAGLDGIKKKMKPPRAVEEDVYHFSDAKLSRFKIDTLPHSLWQALRKYTEDPLVRQTLGEHTYQRYLEVKTKEWDDFRAQVTPWELEKYLEIY